MTATVRALFGTPLNAVLTLVMLGLFWLAIPPFVEWAFAHATWDGLSRRNTPLAGRWSVKDEKVCLRQSKPPTLPISFCTPFPEHGEPGVQWASRDVTGTPIKLSLQKGMPAPPVSR